MKELEDKIREILPYLNKIEKGQRFYSKYYGIITATNITKHGENVYSVYGFDDKTGLPRDNYYPRELELIGYDIKLNDILEYLLLKNLNDKYYAVYFDLDGCFTEVEKYSDGDVQESKSFQWNLSSVYLADQSIELKEWLNGL